MKPIAFLCLAALGLLFGCSNDENSLEIFSMVYDFNQGDGGWIADFTDYSIPSSPQEEEIYDWTYYYGDTVQSANGQKVMMLSCNNVNGDVFMFLKKKVDRLLPNTNYNLVFDITVSSNAKAGEGVILKVGGSDLEPKKVIENNYYTLNLDKGTYVGSGESLISLGDIGLSGLSNGTPYIGKNNANSFSPLIAKSNSKGEIWLIVGTDSILQGYNRVIYSKINVVFSVAQ